jgi:hypothetical protein
MSNKSPLEPIPVPTPSGGLPPNAPVITGFTCNHCERELEWIEVDHVWVHKDDQSPYCEDESGILTDIPQVEG